MANRPKGVRKQNNDYKDAISISVFDGTPKAVLAAIAVSLIHHYAGVQFEHMDQALLEEWETLHKNGIVPQKPFKNRYNKHL